MNETQSNPALVAAESEDKNAVTYTTGDLHDPPGPTRLELRGLKTGWNAICLDEQVPSRFICQSSSIGSCWPGFATLHDGLSYTHM